jgi:hypothetical protein
MSSEVMWEANSVKLNLCRSTPNQTFLTVDWKGIYLPSDEPIQNCNCDLLSTLPRLTIINLLLKHFRDCKLVAKLNQALDLNTDIVSFFTILDTLTQNKNEKRIRQEQETQKTKRKKIRLA